MRTLASIALAALVVALLLFGAYHIARADDEVMMPNGLVYMQLPFEKGVLVCIENEFGGWGAFEPPPGSILLIPVPEAAGVDSSAAPRKF